MSEIAIASTLGFRIGDKISYAGESHRFRRRVEQIPSSTMMAIKLYLRPSRGFARHQRRVKRRAA